MNRRVFLDTVGLLALWDERDRWHGKATEVYRQIKLDRADFFTTDHVLLECGNAAARRPYRSAAVELYEFLLGSQRLISPTSDDLRTAWNAYRRGENANAGIVDQVSFIVMRRMGLTQSFTNDRHFEAAGFEVLF